MLKFAKWLYVICTLLWVGLLVYALIFESANYKILFIIAAATVILLNVTNFICLLGDEREREAKKSSLKP